MPVSLSRRDFLKSAATLTATVAAGCQPWVSQTDAGIATKEDVPRLVPTLCGMCEAHCGVLAYTQGEKLLKLEGNFRHSHSLGKICPRGAAGAKLLDDTSRLRTPLKRVDGRFEPIPWEPALNEIGARLSDVKKKYGAQSMAQWRRPRVQRALSWRW